MCAPRSTPKIRCTALSTPALGQPSRLVRTKTKRNGAKIVACGVHTPSPTPSVVRVHTIQHQNLSFLGRLLELAGAECGRSGAGEQEITDAGSCRGCRQSTACVFWFRWAQVHRSLPYPVQPVLEDGKGMRRTCFVRGVWALSLSTDAACTTTLI